MPEREKLNIVQGTTKVYEVDFLEDGHVFDITGYTVYFTVKLNMNDVDGDAKIAKVITTHADAVNGVALIELRTTDTDIDVANYYYSIDVKTPDDDEVVLLTGRLRISKPVLNTRS